MTKRLLTIAILLTAQACLAAQQISSAPEGKALFAEQCASCHGADAQGSDRAPKLAGSRSLHGQSTEQIRGTIQHGIAAGGMPAFPLPARQLDALAAFVRSLNTEEAGSVASGDAAAGRIFFFGKGKCASCHMVGGDGSPIGPDLSSVGREMSADQIRRALLEPDATITPGYQLVSVSLRNGQTLRGFARGESSFDLQLQDLKGGFHPLQKTEISSLQRERQSLMRPLAASAGEMGDLLSYLSQLKGIVPGAAREAIKRETGKTSDINFERIVHPAPGDWLTYNGQVSGNRYSELTQINADNVNKLSVQWVFPVAHFGLETTPLVADGIMYITGPNQAFALDARTGRQIWHYSRPRSAGLLGDAALGSHRGVALLGDKVFMVTDNAHLIALNRITGSLVWDIVMPDEPQHYGSTVAPLIVKDRVIVGVSGGDRGIRGFLAAYDAKTGKRIWRRWIIPFKGEPGAETWKGKEPTFGGGATWLTGSYDSGSDTLYWPTGNPFPDSDDRDRGGDNLYTDCVLALDPATGDLKWYYQFTPHDVRDWDANETTVLVDTRYKGENRKLLLQANRNGFFYVLDRTNGRVLLADKFVHKLTWATGIGADGRPQLTPSYLPGPAGEVTCPQNATNWNAPAYSPLTRFFYVMALEACRFDKAPGSPRIRHSDSTENAPQYYLRAIDIDTGKLAWEIPQVGTLIPKTWPGVLATAGKLVFYGDPNGAFAAVDDKHGKPLWHFTTNVPMKASPMTYAVDGKQYVATVAGPNIICFGLPAN
jgi:PQQ-dependent dehydrogenase (methanol/ethanol family)